MRKDHPKPPCRPSPQTHAHPAQGLPFRRPTVSGTWRHSLPIQPANDLPTLAALSQDQLTVNHGPPRTE